MNKNIILGIVVVLLVALGIYLFSKDEKVIDQNTEGNPAAGTTENISESDAGRAILASVIAKKPLEQDGVKVISIEEKEWPDACLGKPGEGELCAQVITPGYEVKAEVSGEVRTYRTSLDGSIIRRD